MVQTNIHNTAIQDGKSRFMNLFPHHTPLWEVFSCAIHYSALFSSKWAWLMQQAPKYRQVNVLVHQKSFIGIDITSFTLLLGCQLPSIKILTFDTSNIGASIANELKQKPNLACKVLSNTAVHSLTVVYTRSQPSHWQANTSRDSECVAICSFSW